MRVGHGVVATTEEILTDPPRYLGPHAVKAANALRKKYAMSALPH